MELRTICNELTAVAVWGVVFCMVWPFVTIALFRRGERSSVPVTAMLIPIAVGVGGAWLGLVNVLEGLSRYGEAPHAEAAGIAESLYFVLVGAISAGCVGVVALIRRHRPVVDRGAVVLAALLVADIGAALALRPTVPFSSTGAILTGVLLIAMFVWLFLVARRRVTSPAVAFGVPVAAAAMLVMILLTWQRVQEEVRIAIGG